jgi:hypothetical protein
VEWNTVDSDPITPVLLAAVANEETSRVRIVSWPVVRRQSLFTRYKVGR